MHIRWGQTASPNTMRAPMVCAPLLAAQRIPAIATLCSFEKAQSDSQLMQYLRFHALFPPPCLPFLWSGTWCNVIARDNWYPWDVSYMSRGRCVPYATEGQACEVPSGLAPFPMKKDGTYFERATLCDPSTLICSGESIAVLPPTCVLRRTPADGCISTKSHGCPGRPDDATCPDSRFCQRPGSKLSQLQLEQCATVFNGFNGPSFSIGLSTSGNADSPDDEEAWRGLPSDNNFEAGIVKVRRNAGEHGESTALANEILRTLWPYPVCGEGRRGSCPEGSVALVDACVPCTSFPLPSVRRDDDGGLLPINGLCDAGGSDCRNASYLLNGTTGRPLDGLGAIDYQCSWAIMHALSHNGPPVLTVEQAAAFISLIRYVQGQFDCKVCRSNFMMIVEDFKLPTGYVRADYAAWFNLAHNNANEHSYATHSPSAFEVPALKAKFPPNKAKIITTRMDHWANPVRLPAVHLHCSPCARRSRWLPDSAGRTRCLVWCSAQCSLLTITRRLHVRALSQRRCTCTRGSCRLKTRMICGMTEALTRSVCPLRQKNNLDCGC